MKVRKHRCFSCEYCEYDHHLEYYPYYVCRAVNYKEISLGWGTHVDRMEFCPLYGPETDDEEMVEI